MPITLEEAQCLIAATLREGRTLKLKPLAAVVLDAGGHLIACQREDGASFLRPAIAQGKAAGALALGVSSRQIAGMASERPTFVASLAAIAPSGVVPAAGGLLIVDDRRMVRGAVGVSGDSSDNDELCALAGITAAGLTALD